MDLLIGPSAEELEGSPTVMLQKHRGYFMKMIENTGMVSTPGMTASSTRAGGKMESNMVKEPTEKMDVID